MYEGFQFNNKYLELTGWAGRFIIDFKGSQSKTCWEPLIKRRVWLLRSLQYRVTTLIATTIRYNPSLLLNSCTFLDSVSQVCYD